MTPSPYTRGCSCSYAYSHLVVPFPVPLPTFGVREALIHKGWRVMAWQGNSYEESNNRGAHHKRAPNR